MYEKDLLCLLRKFKLIKFYSKSLMFWLKTIESLFFDLIEASWKKILVPQSTQFETKTLKIEKLKAR